LSDYQPVCVMDDQEILKLDASNKTSLLVLSTEEPELSKIIFYSSV